MDGTWAGPTCRAAWVNARETQVEEKEVEEVCKVTDRNEAGATWMFYLDVRGSCAS